ncbi:A/G-specific adenine glycosylase [Arsenicibacter rosenii]|uniref:Adenine DNA glycosylase n=1 Tax=Arsenicibacter rosenii TaxID=1750698 RepID=A0A1S2VJC2_9BACT|nr:A/G-specific adenine glycosylase [Arsenicibacter rosenii]OIN58823.1 A/G-specific adenine glycosylase [Arsenicibacter rosenii]
MDWQSDNKPNEVTVQDTFAPVLEAWYERHKRNLPWRHTRDPYAIWLSEVILQQTRVAQGLPYYERFLNTYPHVRAMAEADERDILRLWQGLGYYSRARNMHQTARQITTERAGKFPDTYQSLLQLKGIGAYTAAAIASFAFGERVAVVDGNVYRVLARVFGISEDITTTQARKTFATLAQQLIQAANDPATYNQAIMEFGAIQCTPVAPDCLLCPVHAHCVAFQTGRQHLLPVKSKKAAVRERFFTYIVLTRLHPDQGLQLAMRERTDRDVWQNLYDFYLIETDEPKESLRELSLPENLSFILPISVAQGHPVKLVQLLSHQRIRGWFYQLIVPYEASERLPDGFSWFTPAAAEQLPKPVLITNYLQNQLG